MMHLHSNTKERVENSTLHLLPCSIKGSGEANVSKFFEPVIVHKEDKTLECSFRGYPLNGQVLQVPVGYLGYVLHEPIEKLSEEIERNIYVSETFNKFTYWNYDKKTSQNDSIHKFLHWVAISKVLHAPVAEDDP